MNNTANNLFLQNEALVAAQLEALASDEFAQLESAYHSGHAS
jgi:hypothetical protein